MAQKQAQTPTQYYIPSSQHKPSQTPASPQPQGSGRSVTSLSVRKLLANVRQAILGTLRGQFLAQASFILLLSLLLAVMVSQSFSRASDDLNTIGNSSIAGVDAAQAMAQYIEDIDARSADYLATAALTDIKSCDLISNGQTQLLTVHDCDDRNIDAELILLNKALFDATHNVAYPGERTAIERTTAGIEEYVADIGKMRYEYQQATNKANTQDVHMQRAYQAYLAATSVLHQHINLLPGTNISGDIAFNESQVPDCIVNGQRLNAQQWAMGSIEDSIQCLNNINKEHLDAAYDDTMSFLNSNVVLYGGLCLLLCILLGVLTLRMLVITHRIINIGLTLALLTSIVFSFSAVGLFASMTGPHGSFGQMVKDDYDSVYYAAQLQRYGTAANADESRWLVTLAFNDLNETDHWAVDWQNNTAQVEQLIQRAQKNRTWPEEDQPLAGISTNWSQYFSIDGQIRTAANDIHDKNRIANAEALSTGTSNKTFAAFTFSVDQLSAANRAHYNATFSSMQQALQVYIWLSMLLFPLIGLTTLWGVTSRMRDF